MWWIDETVVTGSTTGISNDDEFYGRMAEGKTRVAEAELEAVEKQARKASRKCRSVFTPRYYPDVLFCPPVKFHVAVVPKWKPHINTRRCA